MLNKKPRIAVLIPCHNEEKTISNVVLDFKRQLPAATVYVFDNASNDFTAREAKEAGAKVYYESRKGKGNVVRSMFRLIDADIYVMVDGDGTYPPAQIRSLLSPVLKGEADMVVGSRLSEDSESKFKQLNLIGNRMFIYLVNLLFNSNFTDLLSGYRVFNKKIVKSLPLVSRGFEIESEITLKCLQRGFRIIELPVNLGTRHKDSSSKIRILRDGFLILNTILSLLRDYKPLTVFGGIGILLGITGFLPGCFVIKEFIQTGLVTHIPLALLSVGFVLAGLLTSIAGLVLHSISRRFQEIDSLLQNIAERTHRGTVNPDDLSLLHLANDNIISDMEDFNNNLTNKRIPVVSTEGSRASGALR
jgi:glycosyltransferase involved in cell wall biosynthesis